MYATVLLIGLSLAGQPKEETAPGKKYSLDLSKTTAELKPGASGQLWLQIQAAPGYKISTEAPLKIALSSDNLKLHKTALGATDAKDQKATSPEFGVKFGAEQAGECKIDVDATFFVCDAKICERQKEKVTALVKVKP